MIVVAIKRSYKIQREEKTLNAAENIRCKCKKRVPSQRISSFVNKGALLKVEFISCLHGCICRLYFEVKERFLHCILLKNATFNEKTE